MNSVSVNQLENGNTEMFEIRRFIYDEPDDVSSERHQQTHRHGDFLFFVMNKGNSQGMIDFYDVLLAAPSVCYILPSQVHRRINKQAADYWLLPLTRLLSQQFAGPFFTASEIIKQISHVLKWSTNALSRFLNSFIAFTGKTDPLSIINQPLADY